MEDSNVTIIIVGVYSAVGGYVNSKSVAPTSVI